MGSIDVICLILLLLAIYKGFQKGLVVAVFSFLGIFIGLAAALKLSAMLAKTLGTYTHIAAGWLPFLAFLLIMLGVWVLVRMGASLVKAAFEMVFLGWLNTVGGVLVYGFLYLTVFSILLFYAKQLQLLQSVDLNASKAYPYLESLAPTIMHWFGRLIPFFKDSFQELTLFFERISKNNVS
jgi:membrane protein required for colicin V production